MTQIDIKNFKGIKKDQSLARYTTLKVGGKADLLYIAKDKKKLEEIIRLATQSEIPITILGWGSNVLISDRGIRGLVIINRINKIKILDDEEGGKDIELIEKEEETLARLDQIQSEIYGNFTDLDYNESHLPTSLVYVESGASLPLTIYKTIKADLTGLQWFAGIPGTIGGAIYNNIHGGTHFFEEIIDSVEILDRKSLKTKILTKDKLQAGYDQTIFHKTKDFILSAKLRLYHGDSEKAMYVFKEWKKRKSFQPQNSPGCVWQNLSQKEKEQLNLPTSSVGYIIDKILNLKGTSRNGALISPKHAAFIENTGSAKASDILYLMKLIYNQAKKRLGISLKPEIFLLGFKKEEIKEFLPDE